MSSFAGHTITYDGIGNPLSYYNGSTYTFTWEGRNLVGATKGSTNMSFTYDDNGIRTSKTVDNVKHSYYLNGNLIVAEQWSDKLLVYLYDAAGSPIGMMFRKTSYAEGEFDVYWFTKNLQGDILSVYNESGQQEAYYSYNDAWGNHTAYVTTTATEGAQYNPFRYRGYYYDTDLGMYYLQSRYYDSKICRFISADGYVSTGQGLTGYNMFAYCGNNPVNMVDPYGEFPWLITIFLLAMTTVGAVIGYNLDINSQEPLEGENEEYPVEELTEGEKIKNSVIGAAFGLAAGGVVILAGAGVYGAIFGIGSEYLGVTALQGMAIGGLAMNIPAWLVLPIFGIEIEAFEYELPSYNTNQPIFD